MMVWTFLPPHSLVVFQAGLANLIRRIGPYNHGMKVCTSSSAVAGVSHELENCYHVHLLLLPALLKIFCPLPIKIRS
ncbi:hypothetical protein B0H14DRAFT_2907307 [Mycena olivaceomarginata]|nr:hypothetical protein B0H14DRAFT_2907307 [Mycena olivaceomarginata]